MTGLLADCIFTACSLRVLQCDGMCLSSHRTACIYFQCMHAAFDLRMQCQGFGLVVGYCGDDTSDVPSCHNTSVALTCVAVARVWGWLLGIAVMASMMCQHCKQLMWDWLLEPHPLLWLRHVSACLALFLASLYFINWQMRI